MKAKLMSLLKEDAGQGMTEYGLIIALVAVVVIGALAALGTGVKDNFTKVTDKLGSTPQ